MVQILDLQVHIINPSPVPTAAFDEHTILFDIRTPVAAPTGYGSSIVVSFDGHLWPIIINYSAVVEYGGDSTVAASRQKRSFLTHIIYTDVGGVITAAKGHNSAHS